MKKNINIIILEEKGAPKNSTDFSIEYEQGFDKAVRILNRRRSSTVGAVVRPSDYNPTREKIKTITRLEIPDSPEPESDDGPSKNAKTKLKKPVLPSLDSKEVELTEGHEINTYPSIEDDKFSAAEALVGGDENKKIYYVSYFYESDGKRINIGTIVNSPGQGYYLFLEKLYSEGDKYTPQPNLPLEQADMIKTASVSEKIDFETNFEEAIQKLFLYQRLHTPGPNTYPDPSGPNETDKPANFEDGKDVDVEEQPPVPTQSPTDEKKTGLVIPEGWGSDRDVEGKNNILEKKASSDTFAYLYNNFEFVGEEQKLDPEKEFDINNLIDSQSSKERKRRISGLYTGSTLAAIDEISSLAAMIVVETSARPEKSPYGLIAVAYWRKNNSGYPDSIQKVVSGPGYVKEGEDWVVAPKGKKWNNWNNSSTYKERMKGHKDAIYTILQTDFFKDENLRKKVFSPDEMESYTTSAKALKGAAWIKRNGWEPIYNRAINMALDYHEKKEEFLKNNERYREVSGFIHPGGMPSGSPKDRYISLKGKFKTENEKPRSSVKPQSFTKAQIRKMQSAKNSKNIYPYHFEKQLLYKLENPGSTDIRSPEKLVLDSPESIKIGNSSAKFGLRFLPGWVIKAMRDGRAFFEEGEDALFIIEKNKK